MDVAKRTAPIAALRRRAALPIVLAGVLAGASGRLVADDLSGYLEFVASRVDTSVQGVAGVPIDSSSRSFLQRYSIDWTKDLFPTLSFQVGGLVEKQAIRFDVGELDLRSTTSKFRPYVALRFRTPVQLAELTYDRDQQRQGAPGTPTQGLVRERYTAALGWYPVELPNLRFALQKTNSFDEARRFLDTTENLYQISSEYLPVEPLRLYYNGSASDITDRIHGNEIEGVTHAGRVTYSDELWRDRITVYSDYSINSVTTTTTTSGTGEVSLLRASFAGLSSIDDTPEDGALAATPALIDDNLAAGTTIDLGLPAIGGETRPRNIGLDFARAMEVNTLYVWVDRDLRSEIVQAFSWRIYTSDDNQNWRFRQTVSPAPFGPFLTRFEIRFANVTSRYIKVVTSPLTPGVPFASSYPTILVTELQGLLTEPAEQAEGKISGTSQVYSLDVRTRLLDSVALYYELTYFLTKAGSAPSLYTLSNGLSISYPIDEIFSVAARLAREDGRDPLGDRVAYIGTASLFATLLPTLQQNVIYSGTDETIADLTRETRSVFLNNTAELYRGVDVGLSLGKSDTLERSSQRTRSGQINGYATLAPNEKLTVNLTYRGQRDELSGGGYGEGLTVLRHDGEANLAYRPLSTLYLFGSYRVESRTGLPTRNIHSYSFDWSPFPEGTIHFNLSYNETLRSDADIKERVFTPSVRWDITRRAFLDLSYQKLTNDASTERTEIDILSGDLRISF